MSILSNISLNIYLNYTCLLSLEINKMEELVGMMSIIARDVNSNANSISNLFVTLKNKIFSILFFSNLLFNCVLLFSFELSYRKKKLL